MKAERGGRQAKGLLSNPKGEMLPEEALTLRSTSLKEIKNCL